MASARRNQAGRAAPRRATARRRPTGPQVPGWAWLACLLVPLIFALPLSPSGSGLRTAGAEPVTEARAIGSLAQAVTRLVAPLATPRASFGFPRAQGLAADAPGVLPALLALPAQLAGENVLAFQLTTVLLQASSGALVLLLATPLLGNAGALLAALLFAMLPALLWGPLAVPLVSSPLVPATAWAVLQLQRPAGPLGIGTMLVTALLLVAAPTVVFVPAIGAGVLMLPSGRTPAARRTRGRVLLVAFLVWTARLVPAPTASAVPDVSPFRALTLEQLVENGGPGLAILALLGAIGAVSLVRAVRTPGRRTRRAATATLSGWRLLACTLVLPVIALDATAAQGWPLARHYMRTHAQFLLVPTSGLSALSLFALALLAAAGFANLVKRRLAPTPAGLAALGLAAVILAPGIAQQRALGSVGTPLRPPADEADLLAQIRTGAVLDLPVRRFDASAHRAHGSAWHGQATNLDPATSGMQDRALDPLANSLASPVRAEALAALGIRYAIVHKHDFTPAELRAFRRELAHGRGAGGRLRSVAESPGHLLLGLRTQSPWSSDLETLETNRPAENTWTSRGGRNLLVLALQAEPDLSFVHPEPGRRDTFKLQVFDARDRLVSEQATRGSLPLAIGAGDTAQIALDAVLPETEGRYTVMLTPAADPALTLAIQPVVVAADAGR